jgi:hypothetical protein
MAAWPTHLGLKTPTTGRQLSRSVTPPLAKFKRIELSASGDFAIYHMIVSRSPDAEDMT